MLKTVVALFIIFFSHILFAQLKIERSFKEIEFEVNRDSYEKMRAEESDVMISRVYRRGPHLIYDCQGQHFACVSPLSRQTCENERKSDLKEEKLELSCAPLKAFSTTSECESTQRDVMLRLVKKEFCWNLDPNTLYKY